MIIIAQIIYSFLGSLFFAVIFNIRRSKIIFAAIGGGLSWTVYLLFLNVFSTDLPNYVFAAIVASVYSEIIARVKRVPATVTLVPSIIPLLPGGNLYLTMKYFINGDYEMFFSFGSYTFEIAGAIAMGIMTVTSSRQIIRSFKIRKNKE